MTNELNIWKSRIERAKSLQQRKHSTWRNNIKLYNCSYFDEVSGVDQSRVDVHFAKWYVDNFIPLVYFRDPYIFIKGRTEGFSTFADTMEKAINIYWKRLEMKQQFKKVILSAALMPPGWLKVGYTAKIGQDVEKLEEIKQKTFITKIKDTISGVIKKVKPSPTPEEQGVLNQYIEEESIFSCFVPSWNMLMPEGYQHYTDMPYLIEIEDIPKIDFLANPLYKNKDKVTNVRDIRQTETGTTNTMTATYNSIGSSSGGDVDDELSVIRLYHVWDRRTNKRFTMSYDAFHFEGKWSYDVHGFPYEPLQFEDTISLSERANPYPTDILTPILPQILEQSNLRTQMSNWRKRASALIMAQKGLLTEDDLRQIEETDGTQICYVSNIGAVQMIQTPNLPSGVFDVDEIIKQDLQMGTNMGQMMFAAQHGTRTATQASIAQSGLQLKSSARVDVVEDYTVRVARKLCGLLWQFYDREQIGELIGEEVTQDMWIDLPDDLEERKRIINSEIQYRIDAGSAAPPKDETVDRKQLLDMASIIMTIAPERINKGEFAKQLIKKFKFTKELDKVVISNDEEETKAATEENQLLANNIPQVVSPNENHILHISVHQQAPPTPAMDVHLQAHGNFLGIKPNLPGGPQSSQDNQQAQQGQTPQKGDLRPPLQSSNPDINRQGIPNSGNIASGVQGLGAGTRGKAI